MLSKEDLALLPEDYLMHDMNAERLKHISIANAWTNALLSVTTVKNENQE